MFPLAAREGPVLRGFTIIRTRTNPACSGIVRGKPAAKPMAQFAVIRTGGKQYKVTPGQKLKIEKLAAPAGGEPRHERDVQEGAVIHFDEVLLVAEDEKIEIGTPSVEGATVDAKVLGQGRDRKKIVFKYHSKSRYRKKKGHRQPYTEIEITTITS